MKSYKIKKFTLTLLAKATWLFRLVEISSQFTRPRFLVHFVIWIYFVKIVKVNINDAKRNKVKEYESFIDFFTRKLLSEKRPIAKSKNAIVSPVDAKVVSAGTLHEGYEYLIKGKYYALNHLLPSLKQLENFEKKYSKIPNKKKFNAAQKVIKKLQGGTYISQYLSPRDYHRIHMPTSAKIVSVTFLGEQTLPVNDFALTHFDDVFQKNRRAVILAESRGFSFAMVLITALNVGKIVLHFDPELSAEAATKRTKTLHKTYTSLNATIGEDIAAFHLGSSVFTVFEKGKVTLSPNLVKESILNVKESILNVKESMLNVKESILNAKESMLKKNTPQTSRQYPFTLMGEKIATFKK